MRKTLLTGLAMAVIGTAMMAGGAAATPMLELKSGAVTIDVADGSVFDSNPAVGVVTYIGPVGAWMLNVTTGMAGIEPGFIDLNSVDTTKKTKTNAGGAGTLTIDFRNTIFGPSLTDAFTSAVGGTIAANASRNKNSVSFDLQIDGSSRSLLSFSNPDIIPNPYSSYAFSGDAAFNHTLTAGAHTIDMLVKISHQNAGTTSFDWAVTTPTPAPEPASMLLFGTGLVGLATGARRRMKKN